MTVVLLVVLIWAVVLVPPAVRAHAARRKAFAESFGRPLPDTPPPPARSAPVQRRRRIAGGLLIAMATTLVMGLLPTFRVLLVVHLFLLDSFLAYVALLAHTANRAARARGAAEEPAERVLLGAGEGAPEARRRRRTQPRPALLGELGPVLPAG